VSLRKVRTIANFQEYILIDQYTIHVEQYVKTDNKKWMFLGIGSISRGKRGK
jgi:Uma2 family endonuclease